MKARLVGPWVLGKLEQTPLVFKLFVVVRKNKEVSLKLKNQSENGSKEWFSTLIVLDTFSTIFFAECLGKCEKNLVVLT